jgi:PemK-like, MazF-like toxin of type II toxin-antitoxin system
MLRGDIWLVNLDPTIDGEIRKTRPCVIINDDVIGVLPFYYTNYRLERSIQNYTLDGKNRAE